jgi:hypothetical protein
MFPFRQLLAFRIYRGFPETITHETIQLFDAPFRSATLTLRQLMDRTAGPRRNQVWGGYAFGPLATSHLSRLGLR